MNPTEWTKKSEKRLVGQIAAASVSTLVVLAAVWLGVFGLPFGWKTYDARERVVMICACASCTVEDCVGRREKRSPLFESYINGDELHVNETAQAINKFFP